MEIQIPPLRERRDEIVPLATYFLNNELLDGDSLTFSTEALAALLSYDWPGNIRELKNVVESTVAITTSSVIMAADLPIHISSLPLDGRSLDRSSLATETLAATREREEISSIKSALNETNNNRTQAARQLGISRASLYKKLNRYDLSAFGQ